MTDSRKVYNTAAWKQLRKRVLEEEQHVCHWCGRQATQVDHLIEIDREPALALERTNLVASCQPCNSKRGNAYRVKKEAAKRQKVFRSPPEVTRPQSPSYLKQMRLIRLDLIRMRLDLLRPAGLILE